MKILQITNGYPNRVFPTYCIFIKEQVESLRKQGIHSDVFVINPEKKRIRGYFTGLIKLFIFLNRNEKYDLIHCHHIFSAFLLLLASPFKKKKILLAFLNEKNTEIDNLPVPKYFGNLIYKIVHKRVDNFIIKNDSRIKESSKKVFYLPNGVNLELFRPFNKEESRKYLSIEKNKILILFVSALSIRKQKRYDRFKAVMNILREDYHLNVDEILMLNENRHDIPFFYNACDLHLLTSDYEGSPNSVKEAMSCNMKIVSTNVGNVEELFQQVSNCSVSKSFAPEEIAKTCFELLNRKIELNSREKIKVMDLDMESVSLKLIKIYKEILN